MQVDRNLTRRLDSLRRKRKNGYRHPHCIIVLSSIRRARAYRELYEEHPCTDIWINRRVLIQIHGLCCSLCIWCWFSHKCLLPVIYFLLYVVYVISCMNWSLRGRWNEFQLFLYLIQRIPPSSVVEVSARSALTEGCEPEWSIWQTATAGVHRVKWLQHFNVVEGFPQGVRERVFLKDMKSWGKAQEG